MLYIHYTILLSNVECMQYTFFLYTSNEKHIHCKRILHHTHFPSGSRGTGVAFWRAGQEVQHSIPHLKLMSCQNRPH